MAILRAECPICGWVLGLGNMKFAEDGSYRITCTNCHRITFVFPKSVLEKETKGFNPSERFKETIEKDLDIKRNCSKVALRKKP